MVGGTRQRVNQILGEARERGVLHAVRPPARFTPGRYKCPAHPDSGRSLKLTYRDNRVDVTCFDAGCGKQAILDRLGLRRMSTRQASSHALIVSKVTSSGSKV